MEHSYGIFIHAWRALKFIARILAIQCHTRYIADYNLNPDVIIIKVSLMNILNVIRVEDVYILNVFVFFYANQHFKC